VATVCDIAWTGRDTHLDTKPMAISSSFSSIRHFGSVSYPFGHMSSVMQTSIGQTLRAHLRRTFTEVPHAGDRSLKAPTTRDFHSGPRARRTQGYTGTRCLWTAVNVQLTSDAWFQNGMYGNASVIYAKPPNHYSTALRRRRCIFNAVRPNL
jgi:hypothetical protein